MSPAIYTHIFTCKPWMTALPCLALLLVLTGLGLEAQDTNIETLTIADGLSQGMIYDIEQTDDGFLWFATKDGLNRYDGYNFEVFTNDPFNPYSIGGNDITSLFEDSRGNLWITLLGRGIDVLEKASGRFLHLPEFEENPGSRIVHCFDESADGTIWAGTDNGLLQIEWKIEKHVTATEPDLKASASVELVIRGNQPGKESFYSVHANPDGTLYVSILGDGMYHYIPSEDRLTLLFKDDSGRRVRLIGESAADRVWVCYTDFIDKVMLIENGSLKEIRNWTNLPYAPAGMHTDGQGNLIWSTRIARETFIYSIPEAEVLRTGAFGKPSLITKIPVQCASMDLDQGGNLWVGTSGYGLQKIKLSRQPFQHFLKGNSVRRILSTDDVYMWMAGTSLVCQFDEATNHANPVPGLPSDVYQYYLTNNGAVYIITIDNKHYYLKNEDSPVVNPRRVNFPAHEYTPITEDRRGLIWAGGLDANLMCFNPASGNIVFLDLSGHLGNGASVFTLHVDADQNLWVGTTNGMAKIPLSDLVIKDDSDHIANANPTFFQTDPLNSVSLRYNFVTSFCDDPHHPDRYIWVSTKGGGLSLLDKSTNKFRHFNTHNSGLPNDVVYGILPDDHGNLWMSTNRGLSRMTCTTAFYKELIDQAADESGGGIIFQNFRKTDGLQSDEFNTSAFYRHPDGRLMFGGINGLTAFYPSQIKDRQSDAPVRITGLKINNLEADYFQPNSPLTRPVHHADQIILRHTQNLVTLDFALMDFATPQENRFRYRLQGVDPDWVNAGANHTANYAQLRPGKYLFEVQGNIGYGAWSASATLGITVLPPWWASWSAYSVYFLLVAAAVYAIFYFFKKRLVLRHQLKLKQEEANRLKELDTFKTHLFTNITHEFRTPLTVILGMVKQLAVGSWQSAIGEKEKGIVANSLTLIENNGKNLLRLINQLLDLSKLENKSFQLQLKQGNIVPYLRYVTESFQSYANGNNLSLRFFSQTESVLMDFDHEQIKQVLTNLISNALKFTPSEGAIEVKLLATQEQLGIQVTDTGIGISTADLPHIFDRFYQADSTSTRIAQGTGIGLAHAQELVKIMGGDISVKSELGKGTTVIVNLPIKHEAAMLTPSDNLLHSMPTLSTVGMYNKIPEDDASALAQDTSLPLLLIIEDNPDVVMYLRSCLENAYQIAVAYNGKIGIERALADVPDFIISDVMMPEKDGYQVCDTLKNDERTSHIPIILLTAKADAASRMTGLRRGADAYLAKPFDVEELLLQIAMLLNNRRRMAAHFSKAIQFGEVLPTRDSTIAEAIQIEDAFMKKVNSIIEQHYRNENFSLPELCHHIGMSRSQLFRKMKAVADLSPSDLIRSYRLTRAKRLLETGDMTVSEVTYHVGFKDPSYFSKIFQDEFGEQPSAIAK